MANEAKGESVTPLNLRIRQSTREELEKQAKAHDCFYGDKVSISKLLDKIGNKEVFLYGTSGYTGTETGFNVLFRMQTQDFIGTLSQVCEIFKTHHLNIIGASTVSTYKEFLNSSQGYEDITVRIPKDFDIDLSTIIKQIENLKVKDVLKYAAEEIKALNKQRPKDKQIDENDLLIPWCKCSASIQVTAKARLGLLADITKAIAEKKISILSTYREINESVMSATHFLLNITSLRDLENLIEAICQVEDIEEVRKTNINQIISDFKLPI